MKLSRNTLKFIAIIAMLIDHIGYIFLKSSSFYPITEFIGMFTFPIMAFFLVEGHKYTKNYKSYLKRMIISALIAFIPVGLAFNIPIILNNSIFFTLTIGLLLIHSLETDKSKNNIAIELLSVLICSIITIFSDWGFIGIILIYLFYKFQTKPYKAILIFYPLALSYILLNSPFSIEYLKSLAVEFSGIFLVIPLLMLYENKKIKESKFIQYFFYAFYPIHLLILYLINLFI